jgi:hypothetical protein
MEDILEKDNDSLGEDECAFFDRDMFDETLASHIVRSCELGLFK